jgi:hypothetical protein
VVLVSAVTEQAMCAAVPGAARRWGRPDAGCASHSSDVVVCQGVERPVCVMHRNALTRAAAKDGLAGVHRLFRLWGWMA